jgi:hypothetical protein
MFDLVVARTETEVNIHNKLRNKIKSTIDAFGERSMGGGTRLAAQFKVITALVSVGVRLAGDFPGAWAEPTGPGWRERVSFKRKVGLL